MHLSTPAFTLTGVSFGVRAERRRVVFLGGQADQGRGEPRTDVGAASVLVGPQTVEAEAGGPRHQPSAHVVVVVEIGAAEPQLGLLYGILRVVHAAEQPVRDVEGTTAVLVPELVEEDPSGVVHVIRTVDGVEV